MIYLDHAATTPPHPDVVKAVTEAMTRFYGNPSSLHKAGAEAGRVLQQAREVAARALGVSPGEIVFTSSGTESNNAALKGVAFQYRDRGRHIVTTMVEHPAVYRVAKQLEELGFSVTYLPVDRTGRVSPDAVERALRDDTLLVSIMHVNNETGSLQPIAEIGRRLKRYPKVLFHVDAVQSFGKVPLDPKGWGIDLLSLTGHKLRGPRGVGLLYVREGVTLFPLLAGGGQEGGLRSGTENVPGIVGMAKAMRLIREEQAAKPDHFARLKRRLVAGLRAWGDRVLLNSPERDEEAAPHIVNFSVPGIKPEVLLHALEEEGYLLSTKSACSSKKDEPSRVLMAMFGDEERARTGIRVSFGYETTERDVDGFLAALEKRLSELLAWMKG